MKRAPLTYRKSALSREQAARLHEIERAFHVRAFGEELARANLDLTIEERHQYLAWMRETSRQNRTFPGGCHKPACPAKGRSQWPTDGA
jgi:hypothetical protein